MVPLAFSHPLPPTLRPSPPLRSSRTPVSHTIRSRPAHIRAVIQADPTHQQDSFEPIGATQIPSPPGVSFREQANNLVQSGQLPNATAAVLLAWFDSYRNAVAANRRFHGNPTEFTERNFSTLLELSRRAFANPLHFKPYHERLRHPFDYYKFGFDFASILLNIDLSTVIGRNNIADAINYASQGHNVVFVSNHQSEGDPFAIDAMLSFVANCDRHFCETMIFMAGDRVRNDPVVAPFTVGRNLLTVYSKKHIDDIPELRQQKLLHNRRTISATTKLFKDGGKVLWFAPSGGRDRRSAETGRVEISPFDPGAVQMMRLSASKSGTPTHFYPMSLWTYDMLPPPSNVGGAALGEERIVNHIPMHMSVGTEIEWLIDSTVTDKEDNRNAYCNLVFDKVVEGYEAIGGYQH